MPVSRSQHGAAGEELARDDALRERFVRLGRLRDLRAEQVVEHLGELVEVLGHPNCLLRDRAVLTLRSYCAQQAEWSAANVPRLFLDVNPLVRAEAAHLVGYLPADQAVPFLPVLVILLLDPDLEIRERAAQALQLQRIQLPRLAETTPSSDSPLVHAAAALADGMIDAADADPAATGFTLAMRLFEQGRSGETPVTADVIRRAVAKLLTC